MTGFVLIDSYERACFEGHTFTPAVDTNASAAADAVVAS